jgi:alpha-ketoglutarate-dependent taurine dioxygenase
VIWDNRCTMHRGRPHDDAHPRDLRRATTLEAGSASLAHNRHVGDPTTKPSTIY